MACAALRSHHPHPYHRHLVAAAAAAPGPLKSSAPPCKFWLRGSCNRGQYCRFSHHSPPTAKNEANSNIASLRSSYSWRRPIEAPPLVDGESRVEEQKKEAIAAPQSESIIAAAPIEAPPLLLDHGESPVEEQKTAEAKAVVAAALPQSMATAAAAATGISAANWPEVFVTKEDGIIFSASHLDENGASRKLHSPITCLVNAPMHPAFLLLGFASGDIGVMWYGDLIHPILLVPRPCLPCGKVLCLASARTSHHSFLLIVAYENGAVLCWASDPHSATLALSSLCILHHPGSAPPVLSMEISQVGVGACGKEEEQHSILLYCAAADGSITVWDLDLWSRLQVLQSGVPFTKILAVGRYLFSGSSDGTIRAWGPSSSSSSAATATTQEEEDPKTKIQLLYTQSSPRQAATGVVDLSYQAMEGGHHLLYAAYTDGTVSMWELHSFKELDVLRVPLGINAMDVARTGGGQGVMVLALADGTFFSTPILGCCRS